MKFQEPDQGSEIRWSLGKRKQECKTINSVKHGHFIGMKVKLILINIQCKECLTLPIELISRRNNILAIAASSTSDLK